MQQALTPKTYIYSLFLAKNEQHNDIYSLHVSQLLTCVYSDNFQWQLNKHLQFTLKNCLPVVAGDISHVRPEFIIFILFILNETLFYRFRPDSFPTWPSMLLSLYYNPSVERVWLCYTHHMDCTEMFYFKWSA